MGHLLEINSKKYAFIHIPKCGGSFFKSIFGLGEKEAIVPSVSILVPSRNGHMTYAQFVNQCIRKLHLGNVEDYEFIAIVRNPWARMVSDYFYIGQTDPQNHGNGEVHRLINSGEWSFKDYVKEAVSRAESSNEGTTMWSYLIDADGKLAVEHIFKMETLNKDIEEFLLKNGVDYKIDQEKINTSKHEHYRSYYDDESRELVRDFEIDTINHFGYEF
tara:strand:+ start:2112 stop:2762 length:651 start_codon:yes stop_codon:yes gene_type:complete